MNILNKIIEHKRVEVAQRKLSAPETMLRENEYFERKCISLADSLCTEDSSRIIAEFKRKSPSKGFINEFADAGKVTTGYTNAGAAGLSILTDETFFGGTENDLKSGRRNQIPILRKDFIIDTYQITEAKAMGADVILLIAACLTVTEVRALAKYAVSLGLEVLLELHHPDELEHICDETILVGINNRNLKDFKVDINASLKMSRLIPSDKIKIAESGITDAAMIDTFNDAGFKGFLIGENFMKEKDPAIALKNFIKQIKR